MSAKQYRNPPIEEAVCEFTFASPASGQQFDLTLGNAARLFHMVQTEGAEITIVGAPPRSIYYVRLRNRRPSYYALWRRKPHNALAYAPTRHAPATVRTWQINPIVRSLPQWPTWP